MHIVMKTVQFICLLVLVTAPALGSNTKVDSLKQLLEQHATTDKAEVLWGIAYELFDVDNTQALFYAERAYHEVWKRGDSLQIVKVGTTYGQLLRRMGKLDHSIEVSSRMLPIAKRHEYRKYWKMLLNSLGFAYIDKSIYDVALDLNFQSLILRQEDADTMELATTLQNIGLIFFRIADWERSLEYSISSIELIKSMSRKPDWSDEYMLICNGNIACVYYEQRRYSEAIKYFRLSLRNSRMEINGRATYLWTFAHSFMKINSFDSANYYAKQGIVESRKRQNLMALAYTYLIMSEIKLKEGDFRQSELFLDSAEQIRKVTDYTSLGYEILGQRLKFLAMTRKGSEVLKAFEEYEIFGDSLDDLNGESRIKSLQVALAQRENESKLKAQSAIMLLQKQNLDRQQTFIFVVSGLLIMMLFLAVALYRSNNQKQEVNQMLDRIVEARTKELSKHRDSLQHLIDEENGRRGRASAELMGMFKTLKGLLYLAKIDPGKRDDDYLEKALGLTIQMESVSQKYNEQTHRKPQIPTT